MNRTYRMTITDIDHEANRITEDDLSEVLERALNRHAEHGRIEVLIEEVEPTDAG